jgi:hypothetical protein
MISVSVQPRLGYLKFDLRQLSGTVTDARLRLRVMGHGSGPHSMRLRTAGDGWSEAMTWSTRPPAGAVQGSAFTPTKDSWAELDVTSAAVGEQAGDGVLTLQLEALSGYAGFASREAPSQYRPRLMVTSQ